MKFIILLSLLLSCSSKVDKSFERKQFETYFMSTGVSKYFLPNLPIWANFSEKSSCQKNKQTRFLNYELLLGNFQLTYRQFIQLQVDYNLSLHSENKSGNNDDLPFEEKLFYHSLERIQKNIMPFNLPNFPRFHLIWIDFYINQANKIKEFVSSEWNASGYPVFLSLCYSQKQIEEFIVTQNIIDGSYSIIPMDAFSIYRPDGSSHPQFSLFLKEFFPENAELHLVYPGIESTQFLQNNQLKIKKL